MFMNWQSWILVLGFTLFIMSFVSFPLQLLIIVFMVFYHRFRFQKGTILFLIICMMFLMRIHYPNTKPTNHIYEIMEIKSNYVIAKQKQYKMIVYGLEDAHIGDIYELKGYVQKIDNVTNFDCFSFQQWANRRSIEDCMNVTKAIRLDHGKKLSHHLYQYIKTKEANIQSFLLMMIYGIHQDEVSYMLISSGMHLAFLSSVIKRIFKKYKKYAEYGCVILFVMIALISQPSSALYRMICFQLCNILFKKESSKTRLGCAMVLTLFLMPYLYCEISFVLPVLYRFSSIFCMPHYSKMFHTLTVMIPIQLLYYHQCSIVQVLCFRFLRIFYALIYLYAWCLLFLPISHLYPFVEKGMTFLQSIDFNIGTIYGSIPIIFLFWYIEVMLKFYHQKKISHFIEYLLCISCIIFQSRLFPFTRILTIDVGQGDCSVIIEPFAQEVIMIDVMGNLNKNIPKDIIVDRLHTLGITAIDTLIITHEDYDHSGGYEELKQLMKVKQVIRNKETAKKYQNDYLKLLLLDYQGKDENDNSIVSYYEKNHISILFMGDLGVEGEKELMKQYPLMKSDFIKLGHHGSRTSSSIAFIHQIQPKFAIISAGRGNRYSHPHQDVLERLEKENVFTHITNQQGEGDLYITPLGAIFMNTNYEIYLYK